MIMPAFQRSMVNLLDLTQGHCLSEHGQRWKLVGNGCRGSCLISADPTLHQPSLDCGFNQLTTTYPRDPSTQIIPTLGPKVCKYYLHWAIWIPRVIGFGSRFGDLGTFAILERLSSRVSLNAK